jgi:hypothetical protein
LVLFRWSEVEGGDLLFLMHVESLILHILLQ